MMMTMMAMMMMMTLRSPQATVLVRASERAYAAQLAALPGGGRFDCVLDSLGGQYFSAALEALDPMGRIVHFGATYSYGGASGGLWKWITLIPGYLMRPRLDPGKLVGTNRGVLGFNLIWLTVTPTRPAPLHVRHTTGTRPAHGRRTTDIRPLRDRHTTDIRPLHDQYTPRDRIMTSMDDRHLLMRLTAPPTRCAGARGHADRRTG